MDTLDGISRGLGVAAGDLISVSFRDLPPDLARVVDIYTNLDDSGKFAVLQAAEAAVQGARIRKSNKE